MSQIKRKKFRGVGRVLISTSTMENPPVKSQNVSATEKGRPDSIHAATRRETESVTNVSTHSLSRKGLQIGPEPKLDGYSALPWPRFQ